MKRHGKQYTIRNVPLNVDRALRRMAKSSGRSLNQVALESLVSGTGESPTQRTDFDFLIGTMTDAEARSIDKTIEEQRTIDPELWR